jgi:hypothetical protein
MKKALKARPGQTPRSGMSHTKEGCSMKHILYAAGLVSNALWSKGGLMYAIPYR